MTHSDLRLRKAYPQHWYDISIGISNAHLTLVIDTQNNQLRCEFYIPDSKELYRELFLHKDTISSKLDYDLEWMELEGKKASRIRTTFDSEVDNTDNWEICFNWLLDSAKSFYAVFTPILKKIKL